MAMSARLTERQCVIEWTETPSRLLSTH